MSESTCLWYNPSCWLDSLILSLQQLAITIWDAILSGLASLIELIPAPDFLTNTGTIAIPESIAWAASAFQLDYGLTVIVSAYTLRFILRRIPGIG